MRKYIISYLFLMLFHTACWSQSELEIGTDSWPPYEYEENGEIVGICTDIVKHVLSEMGVKIKKITIYPWKRAISYVNEGKIDALYTAGFSSERATKLHFPSVSLIDTKWVVFKGSKAENGFEYNSLLDLKEVRVGIVRGYTYTPELWQLLKETNNYVEVEDEKTLFKMLGRGRFDVVISEYGVGVSMLNNLGLKGQVRIFANKPIKIEHQYIIFSKKNIHIDFVEKFSNELKNFKNSKKYYDILIKYTGTS